MSTFRLLIHSASQIVQVVKNRELIVRGGAMNNLAVLQASDNCGLSLIVSREGYIVDIGPDDEMKKKYSNAKYDAQIDASGKCVLPGFVDCHTHPVWAGDRVNEFAMKLAGASYLEVHNAGGGIYYSVDCTRQASEDHLLKLLLSRLNAMLYAGTTLVEAKSGYGLNVEAEMKLLRVIEIARRHSTIEISSTFCGAHAIPRGMTSDQATTAIIHDHLPELKRMMDSGQARVDSIDVFCEKGVFDIEQTRKILESGKSLGLRLNYHGDELHHTGSAELAGELQAGAVSHLEKISPAGIEAMSRSGTIGVILPTTAYVLRLTPPPVRQMIKGDVPIALGSDFNPNAFCMSMPMVMHLASVLCGMTMAEALVASTINSAAVLGKSSTHGSLEMGKVGDIVIIGASRWEHLIYQMGCHNTLIEFVIKHGHVVYENKKPQKMI